MGTDAVLLGALVSAGGKVVLEVGCGTGIVSLMMAQRNPEARITAIDINPEATALAEKNFLASPFADRLSAQCFDFKLFESNRDFNQIISNPPYFEPNSSEKDVLARQRKELDFSDLVRCSVAVLAPDGLLSLILPAESFEAFIAETKAAGFYLIRKIDIYGIKNGPLKRCILELSLKAGRAVSETFIIEKSPRIYSDQYLECTAAFHVFNK